MLTSFSIFFIYFFLTIISPTELHFTSDWPTATYKTISSVRSEDQFIHLSRSDELKGKTFGN